MPLVYGKSKLTLVIRDTLVKRKIQEEMLDKKDFSDRFEVMLLEGVDLSAKQDTFTCSQARKYVLSH